MKKFTLLLVLCMLGIMSFAQGYNTQNLHNRPRPNTNQGSFVQDIQSLKSSAEQGDAEAQYTLSYYYTHGVQVKKDTDMAINYLLLAAENEHPKALYMLGCYYHYGSLGLPMWEDKAKECLFRASELGYSDAEKELENLTRDYKPFRKRIRRSVYKQTILVAPQSRQSKYSDKKRDFIRQ